MLLEEIINKENKEIKPFVYTESFREKLMSSDNIVSQIMFERFEELYSFYETNKNLLEAYNQSDNLKEKLTKYDNPAYWVTDDSSSKYKYDLKAHKEYLNKIALKYNDANNQMISLEALKVRAKESKDNELVKRINKGIEKLKQVKQAVQRKVIQDITDNVYKGNGAILNSLDANVKGYLERHGTDLYSLNKFINKEAAQTDIADLSPSKDKDALTRDDAKKDQIDNLLSRNYSISPATELHSLLGINAKKVIPHEAILKLASGVREIELPLVKDMEDAHPKKIFDRIKELKKLKGSTKKTVVENSDIREDFGLEIIDFLAEAFTTNDLSPEQISANRKAVISKIKKINLSINKTATPDPEDRILVTINGREKPREIFNAGEIIKAAKSILERAYSLTGKKDVDLAPFQFRAVKKKEDETLNDRRKFFLSALAAEHKKVSPDAEKRKKGSLPDDRIVSNVLEIALDTAKGGPKFNTLLHGLIGAPVNKPISKESIEKLATTDIGQKLSIPESKKEITMDKAIKKSVGRFDQVASPELASEVKRAIFDYYDKTPRNMDVELAKGFNSRLLPGNIYREILSAKVGSEISYRKADNQKGLNEIKFIVTKELKELAKSNKKNYGLETNNENFDFFGSLTREIGNHIKREMRWLAKGGNRIPTDEEGAEKEIEDTRDYGKKVVQKLSKTETDIVMNSLKKFKNKGITFDEYEYVKNKAFAFFRDPNIQKNYKKIGKKDAIKDMEERATSAFRILGFDINFTEYNINHNEFYPIKYVNEEGEEVGYKEGRKIQIDALENEFPENKRLAAKRKSKDVTKKQEVPAETAKPVDDDVS